ncbi:MAG: hypothetical protein JWQ71_430 [Pedosphaera sp.]|nr:hypothetical protein [Pedosphaera sp.]
MNEQQQPESAEKLKTGKDAAVTAPANPPPELTEEEKRKALRTPPPKKRGPSVTIAPGNPATPDVFDTPPTRL